MLYETLLKLKNRKGLTEDLKIKIDVFYAVGRLTEEEYCDLMEITAEEFEKITGKEYDETENNI